VMATSALEAAIIVNSLYFSKKPNIFQKSYLDVTYIDVTFLYFCD